MEHVESLTKYVTHFVDQLICSGVEQVVISPGSRSTPLAMAFAEHPDIRHWVHLDERSAAFFALGMAKEQRKPVALVCTSGTAAANYYPAIVEGYYSEIPLVVLTADRPHELRDVGAPQAINQIQLFGTYVKWYQDLALPEKHLVGYARTQAARAVEEAIFGKQGPVHLNFPFREPLIPDFTLDGIWREEGEVIPPPRSGKTVLAQNEIKEFTEMCLESGRGLIAVGPQEDSALYKAVSDLAARLGVPVLADPLSGLRTGIHDKRNIIENYDALLKSPIIQEELKPDFIIRFGAMPVSKAYLKWIQRFQGQITHYIVDQNKNFKEPAGVTTQYLRCDPAAFCERISSELPEAREENEYNSMWKKANDQAKQVMLEDPEEELNEGHAVVYLAEGLPDESNLFVGNSMPIRDVDSFFMSTPKDIRLMANRGANGIDGVVSTAIGTAVSGRTTALLLGDVSFFHDLNGLWMAKQKQIPLTVVLINNDGGGIFSYLPQAEHKDHFEELFGTPVGLDFSKAVDMFEGDFVKVSSWEQYKTAVKESFENNRLTVIEVITSRETHVDFHKSRWRKIEEMLVKSEIHV